MKQKLVVLTGAGISAESGLKTFRDSGGLWEGYRVEDVATPDAWARDPEMVLDFYNQRRRSAHSAEPNVGHKGLVELEESFDVTVITQNIDDLHERAGSSNVIHLHGSIFKSRSTRDLDLVYDIEGTELVLGDKCELGSQLRPHIVWFGEAVPMMEVAAVIASTADIFVVVGTSLAVYPAAGLVDLVKPGTPIYIVDPNKPEQHRSNNSIRFIEEKASVGVPLLIEQLS